MATFPHNSVIVWFRVWRDLVKQGKVSFHQHFHSPNAPVWLAFFEKVKDKLYHLSQLQPSHEYLLLGVSWVSESIGIVNEAMAVMAVLMASISSIFNDKLIPPRSARGAPLSHLTHTSQHVLRPYKKSFEPWSEVAEAGPPKGHWYHVPEVR